MTKEAARDLIADQFDELRLFGFAPPKAKPKPPPLDDDDALGLPAENVHLLVDHPKRPLPAPPLDLVSDLDYLKFAEDHRRSRTTVVIF